MLTELRISCLLISPLWCGYVPMRLNGTGVFFFLRSQYELKQAAFKQTRPLPGRDLVGLCYTGVLHCRSGERKKTLPLPGISGGKKFCVKVITLAESLSYSSFCRSLSLHCLQRLSLAFTGRRCCGY